MILGIALTVMTLAAIAIVVLPMIRVNRTAATRAAHEIEIYRDQLDEVERDVARKVISPDEAEAARTEISRRMLAANDGAAYRHVYRLRRQATAYHRDRHRPVRAGAGDLRLCDPWQP